MVTRKQPPKPRRKRAEAEETNQTVAPLPPDNDDAAREVPEPLEGVGLHPIFGRARVATVLVAKVRYRAGNERSPPIKLSIGPMDPAALLDPSQLGPLHGPGRYDLRAIDGNGLTAHPPLQFDVLDEYGEILPYLVAPLPGQTAAVGAGAYQGGNGGGGVPAGAGPSIAEAQVSMWKELATATLEGRKTEFAAMMSALEADRKGGAGGDSGMVTHLRGELTDAKATIREQTKRIDELREKIQELRDETARRKGGEGQMIERLGMMAMDKFAGVGARAGGAAAASPDASGDSFAMPDPATLSAMLQGDQVPRWMLVEAIKLRGAGGIDDARWAVLEPVLKMTGLLAHD